MSIRRVMKQSTMEFVKAGLGYTDADCAITRRGGKPHAQCGEWFLGIWGGGRQWTMTTAHYPSMSVNLTLTMRFSGPMDRLDVALDELEEGFDERMDQLATFLFAKQDAIRYHADELMPAGMTGFVCAPRPMNDPEPEPVGADWFGGDYVRGQVQGRASGGDSLLYGFQATLAYGGWTFQHPVSTGNL